MLDAIKQDVQEDEAAIATSTARIAELEKQLAEEQAAKKESAKVLARAVESAERAVSALQDNKNDDDEYPAQHMDVIEKHLYDIIDPPALAARKGGGE